MRSTGSLWLSFFARVRLQEGGLVLVILVLGLTLTIFGGSVKMPLLETNADGETQRVFRVNEKGEREAVLVEHNKFLNVQNLAQLAKDTSFIAIMAVGVTMVIIAGGIDLSVGAIYALASVLAALVFNHYGPTGPNAIQLTGPNGGEIAASPWYGVTLGILTCLGVSALCGLLNGGMVVALQVHPFIITLGTMAIFRGVAFVATKGLSISGFPESFRSLVRWETSGRLSVIPLAVMILVT